jgi:probable rRNA maturation factor
MPESDQRRGQLRVKISDERGRSLRAAGLGAWLARVAPLRAHGTVAVALVSDRRIRALNRSYRRKDYATDVLSFPGAPAFAPWHSPKLRRARPMRHRRVGGPRSASPQPLAPSPFLGDIVIARGVAKRQARAARHTEATELKILALHGLLHLLGYDHERDHGRMRRVERRLRRKGGLREGLIERAHA